MFVVLILNFYFDVLNGVVVLVLMDWTIKTRGGVQLPLVVAIRATRTQHLSFQMFDPSEVIQTDQCVT